MVYFIANIGFNHNGDVDAVRTMMKLCKEDGFDYVKFDVRMNYGKYELNVFEITEIFQYAKYIDLKIYASCYDTSSVNVLSGLTDFCEIPLEKSNDYSFINYVKKKFKFVIIDIDKLEIEFIENLFYSHGPFLIMYYTENNKSKNLGNFNILKSKLTSLKLGISSNDKDELSNIVSIAYDVDYIQKNVTLCKGLYGDNHINSLEPNKYRNFIKKMKLTKSIL